MTRTLTLAGFAAGLAALTAGPVAAQETAVDPTQAIEHCRTMSTSQLRIACLEAALSARASAGGLSMPADAPARRPAPGAPREAASQSGDGALRSAAPAASGLGAEQVRARAERGTSGRRESAPARVDAVIVDFARTAEGDLLMVLDNGQAWLQTGNDRTEVRLDPDQRYSVSIEAGMLSGYRLRVNELQRILTVERVR